MRTFACILLFVVGPLALVAQASSDISSPQKRMETLDLARSLLTTKRDDLSGDDIAQKDPFNPKQPDNEIEKAPTVKVVGMADRDILAAVAVSVVPSGTIKLGDTQLLLFGQKKLKVGDAVPIVFQGTTYELQITGIERTSYTLRLNKEEITRPIKPVNKP